MKYRTILLTLTIAVALFVAGDAWAVNSVTVESKCVPTFSSNVTIGVWVVNDTPLTGFVLPLECRDTDGNGSFTFASCVFDTTPGGRIGRSPLTGSVTTRTMTTPKTNQDFCGNINNQPQPFCGGPTSNTYQAVGAPDLISPDGFFWAGVSTNGDPDLWYLPPGNDAVAGVHRGWPFDGDSTLYSNVPSFTFTFGVNGVAGTFEIDTMCLCPANHLVATDLNVDLIPFTFTKGVITVGPCNPEPPVLLFIPNGTVRERDSLVFTVSSYDPNGTTPNLSAQSYPSGPLPTNATFVDNGNGTGRFRFLPVDGQEGDYDILFIAADDGGLSASQTVTISVLKAGIRSLPIGGNIPTTYSLEQNYPNPFNAGTVMRFIMPHDGQARLEVYDVLGRKVRTLLNEFRPLGLYAVDWDGRDDQGRPLATGVYFYRLQTDDFVKTRTMVLIK